MNTSTPLLTFGLIVFFSLSGLCQESYNPLNKPNTYRSDNNPYYWNNQKPHKGYWQQDVHYQINAEIDDEARTIDGKQKLTYWNNSPDTLKTVYFHLYQNAFQPGAYYHQLKLANKRKPQYGIYEQQGLGTVIEKFKVNDQAVDFNIDNTILKAQLPKGLPPGDSLQFDINFTTFFGSGREWRRMKMYKHHGVKHFNGVHWYPNIATYDRKFGWTKDQHLGKEFYNDFGTFDVELTFPAEYVVEATGNLTNRDEVFPASLRKRVDIRNYENDDYKFEMPKTTENGDSTRTWTYHAENVHNFAFTADPKYRIGQATSPGDVKCIALVQEHKARQWLGEADYIADIVEHMSKGFGEYAYPKMVVADARDGMEYPMLTLCGGNPPGNHDLIAHEIAHNWFYGMMGNNETYRAIMDEGFTQFSTAWLLNRVDGAYHSSQKPQNFYEEWFIDSINNRDHEVYTWYMAKAIKNKDAVLTTHSDYFNSALGHGGGYRQVYYKMGTMLFNLQYVLGEELFLNAMQNYVEQWTMAHPYDRDFRQSVIDYTGIDLNWFFDQWLNTTKSIDYAVKKVKKGENAGQYNITFKRKGEMQMPIDFRVITRNGRKFDYYIPNTEFEKATSAKILPKWTGWGKLNKTYTANINIPGQAVVKEVIIDPSERLADEYMPDNKTGGNIEIGFDDHLDQYPDWKNYHINWRPDVWYNEVNGLKAGLHFNGDFLAYKHQFHLTAWYNTSVFEQIEDDQLLRQDPDRFPVNFNFKYKNALHQLDPQLDLKIEGKVLDGLHGGYTGLSKNFGDQDRIDLGVKTSIRPDVEDLDFLLYPELWESNQWNNALKIGYTHPYNYFNGKGTINFDIQSSAFGSDYDYTRLQLSVTNRLNIAGLKLRTRTYVEHSLGDNLAPQSRLYAAGARPEKLMNNKYTRSKGFFPDDWIGYGNKTNHFHYGGGLNLRGYSGYVLPTEDGSGLTFNGYSGAALNAEVEFDQYIPFRLDFISSYIDFDAYLFGDAGVINSNDLGSDLNYDDVKGDAGFGTALTIENWPLVETVKPLTIRFDMPLYLSHRPFVEANNFQFRWILGVERAF